MRLQQPKQLALKPQDLLVALKLSVRPEATFTYAELATELFMSSSEVHAAVRRAESCRLVAGTRTELRAIRSSLLDFLLHGIQYVFPVLNGTLTRGLPTGISGPLLKDHFVGNDVHSLVWPDPMGDLQGSAVVPLYPSIPKASRADPKLYGVLTLVDAIRGGAAREREIASELLLEHLK